MCALPSEQAIQLQQNLYWHMQKCIVAVAATKNIGTLQATQILNSPLPKTPYQPPFDGTSLRSMESGAGK